MLLSLAIILLVGLSFGAICKKISIPPLLGMILTGIIIGPYALNLIDSSVLLISADIRKIALIIILTRAGLSLNISDLKKVGRQAILLSFIPASLEIIAISLIAPLIFNITLIEAILMGTVIAAVSPAVIVPKMLTLIESGYGKNKSIPQMILAAASVDDVYVIALFSVLLSMTQSENIAVTSLIQIPLAIVIGVAVGLAFGVLLGKFFDKIHIRDTIKIVIILCTAFLFAAFEDSFAALVPFSSLIGVMCIGISMQKVRPQVSARLTKRFSKMWEVAQILLFVLVGATVNINFALTSGFSALLLILIVLFVRMLGVLICLIKTNLNIKERIFCVFAYLPKATVQAAIGGIPLSVGLACGEVILSTAVLSILITAPLGAFLIDISYNRFLSK